VQEHQQMTVDRHRNLLNLFDDRNLSAQPFSVLQGWGVDDYIDHINQMVDADTLTNAVGIGSVCGRKRADEVKQIIQTVAQKLPNKVKQLHAFGIKAGVLKYPVVRQMLTSSDSQSYDMRARWNNLDVDIGAQWKDNAFEYLRQKRQIKRLLLGREDTETEQTTLADQT
jgi:queuine/archaeosine tRNA-ribosyltransferase